MTISQRTASALQSRVDRRSNVIQDYENQRLVFKTLLNLLSYQPRDNSQIQELRQNYREVRDALRSLTTDQKLDKILLKNLSKQLSQDRQASEFEKAIAYSFMKGFDAVL